MMRYNHKTDFRVERKTYDRDPWPGYGRARLFLRAGLLCPVQLQLVQSEMEGAHVPDQRACLPLGEVHRCRRGRGTGGEVAGGTFCSRGVHACKRQHAPSQTPLELHEGGCDAGHPSSQGESARVRSPEAARDWHQGVGRELLARRLLGLGAESGRREHARKALDGASGRTPGWRETIAHERTPAGALAVREEGSQGRNLDLDLGQRLPGERAADQDAHQGAGRALPVLRHHAGTGQIGGAAHRGGSSSQGEPDAPGLRSLPRAFPHGCVESSSQASHTVIHRAKKKNKYVHCVIYM